MTETIMLNQIAIDFLDMVLAIPAVYTIPFGVFIYVLIQAIRAFEDQETISAGMRESWVSRYAILIALILGCLIGAVLLLVFAPDASGLLIFLGTLIVGPTIAAQASGVKSWVPSSKAEAKKEAEGQGLKVVEEPQVSNVVTEVNTPPVVDQEIRTGDSVVSEKQAIDIVRGMGLDVQ